MSYRPHIIALARRAIKEIPLVYRDGHIYRSNWSVPCRFGQEKRLSYQTTEGYKYYLDVHLIFYMLIYPDTEIPRGYLRLKDPSLGFIENNFISVIGHGNPQAFKNYNGTKLSIDQAIEVRKLYKFCQTRKITYDILARDYHTSSPTIMRTLSGAETPIDYWKAVDLGESPITEKDKQNRAFVNKTLKQGGLHNDTQKRKRNPYKKKTTRKIQEVQKPILTPSTKLSKYDIFKSVIQELKNNA